MKEVRVSVVMSIYNGEQSLNRTIQSILKQEFKDFELIIVDDASTDNTLNEVKKYLLDRRVKLIKNNSNLGLTKSLIKAIENSKGNYIARIDSGDTMRCDRLKKQVSFLDNNLDVGLVGSNCVSYVHENGKLIDQYNGNMAKDYESLKRQLSYRNPISHVSVTFRRSIYNEVGGYDKMMYTSQDYDLWVRLLNKSRAYILEEQLTTIIYEITNSISFQRNKTQIKNGIKIRLRYLRKGLLPIYPTIIGISKSIIMYILPDNVNRFIRRSYRTLIKKTNENRKL